LERAFLVEVRRSKKRRKTIEAYRKGDTIIVAIPARMSKREEERVVAEMVSKLGKDDLRLTSTELMARALELNSLYLGNKATPITVEWSSRMERIWGSCTIEERAIRLSNRLDDAPRYALDYILLHELVHLIVAGHGPDFKALLAGYPQLERAEGYLEGRQIRLEEDLVDAINLMDPINSIESMDPNDPIKSIDPINPINPIDPNESIDSIAKVAAEVAEQVAITALKGPRNSVTTKPRHNHEGQLELISIAEISA
jgi:predicted metal-dependent hydrolase